MLTTHIDLHETGKIIGINKILSCSLRSVKTMRLGVEENSGCWQMNKESSLRIFTDKLQTSSEMCWLFRKDSFGRFCQAASSTVRCIMVSVQGRIWQHRILSFHSQSEQRAVTPPPANSRHHVETQQFWRTNTDILLPKRLTTVITSTQSRR